MLPILQGVFLTISRQLGTIIWVVITQLVQGFVDVETGLCRIHNTTCDIGAMVGYTLKVVEHICKDKAVLNSTLALLQTDDVVKLDLVAQIVNNLLERLDIYCQLNIVVLKGHSSILA